MKTDLWSNIDKRGQYECWQWIGPRFTTCGYGRFFMDRKHSTTAHRMLWTELYGSPHADMQVCHTCDNRLCCNPDHLFLGTAQDNANDKATKGRSVGFKGESNPFAKLTIADVTEIRTSAESHSEIAKRKGVSYGAIRLIRIRETWRHVP